MREKKPRKNQAPTPDEIRAAAESQLSEVLQRLRAKIREAGFTQVEVDQKLGWKRNRMSSLVRGKTALRVDHLFAICEVIGVFPRQLLRIDPQADQALTTLLRTYAHPRQALGEFTESELLAAAEERLPKAKGKKREYLRDVILWCQSSKRLAERSALRRAGKERLTTARDPEMVFPTFKGYQKGSKRTRRRGSRPSQEATK
ncbi:MAG: helix-turn-helix transcriptional regulator [bacterium]|nr:helix-turn-helix transcriptional regulator [bacterium]